ncbi:hypothetical protein FNYG_10490 [Fusarium nygamai]|uniref:DUF1446 domain-containing protein n=1 Tax=Gibberella nygamai TaxID=42673 RepID=A0A2K0W1P5_GIBNY|nr:hypothetical protein FNYG_10490 [Fusarium nygamai]
MSSKRPVRIANCSGAAGDPGDHMLAQAQGGPVDFITGDYLAEVNLAWYVEPYKNGQHPGYVPTALDGLTKSLDLINERRIKVIINGGGLNPKGLADKVQELADAKGYPLSVAYVEGDDLFPRLQELLSSNDLKHLDSENKQIHLSTRSQSFPPKDPRDIVSANAYLGSRAIRAGLEAGADIIICGRVADASPVIAAAQYWHGWSDDAFDELAGALLAGHLIECSTYVTGGNFAGFDRYRTEDLLNLACPIAEVDAAGSCVITRHDSLRGYVTTDSVKCQLLYELQGNMYLNSDVKADLTDVKVSKLEENRVLVNGVRGHPPPPTTKLAIYYKGGYQGEFTINATGLNTSLKYDLQELQIRNKLKEWGVLESLDVLEFQRLGSPVENPRSQNASTTSLRIFVQSRQSEDVQKVFHAYVYTSMQHFPGMHSSLDFRMIMEPKSFLSYYPALVQQSEITQQVHFLGGKSAHHPITVSGAPPLTEPLGQRRNVDPVAGDKGNDTDTLMMPLGRVALARSGDKGSNVNVGFFPRDEAAWPWLRAFLTRKRMQILMGDDWIEDEMYVERVEFPGILAVHFVIYGALGQGVSSSARLDALGKGFGEFVSAVHVPIPKEFVL